MVGHNIIKCTRTMTKQFANGRITIPCVREDQIYQVRMGSLRLYENGQYATASTNATAVSFFWTGIGRYPVKQQLLKVFEPKTLKQSNIFNLSQNSAAKKLIICTGQSHIYGVPMLVLTTMKIKQLMTLEEYLILSEKNHSLLWTKWS